jgi:hypothetical protein
MRNSRKVASKAMQVEGNRVHELYSPPSSRGCLDPYNAPINVSLQAKPGYLHTSYISMRQMKK